MLPAPSPRPSGRGGGSGPGRRSAARWTSWRSLNGVRCAPAAVPRELPEERPVLVKGVLHLFSEPRVPASLRQARELIEAPADAGEFRSEERRVGEEGRTRWWST